MGNWLLEEESRFEPSLMVEGAARAARSRKTYSILLRNVKVLDNRRLFGAADVIVYSVVVDGYPDMKSGQPFWTKQLTFPHVKDGATLTSIDPDLGVLIYRGRARDFVNLYFLVVRDTESSRDLAKLLKENFIAQGIGTVAGAAVSIFANLPPQITAPMARELTTTAVDTTLDFFAGQKNVVIGTYYGSLLKGQSYGVGLHPADYPASRLNCGGALEIAYEVTRETA
jgi:hypothetical protein